MRLTRRAAPRLFLGLLAVPLLQAVLLAVQLLVVQHFAGLLVDADSITGDTLRRGLPSVAVIIGCLVGVLALDNLQTLGRELLTERVRQSSARRMHRAIAQLELVDFELPEIHDRVMRASTTDFRPAQVVRGIIALTGIGFRVVLLTVTVIAIEPLLVPLLLALAVPILLASRAFGADRFAFLAAMTPLERRRLYYNRLLTAREPAGEARAYALTPYFSGRFDELSSKRLVELRSMLGRQWRRMVWGQLTFAVLVSVVVGALGWFFSTGRVDGAALVAAAFGLAQVAALMGGIGWPISELAEANLFLGDQQAFLEQLERTAQPETSGRQPEALRSLEVKNVSFTYPTGDRPALDGVTFRIAKGQIVALVGPNGSGKTTLAKLLGMLFEPSDGQLRWNDEEAGTYDRTALRARISTVFQDFQTYSETIGLNVTLSDLDGPPDPERAAASLTAAGFDDAELDLERLLGPEHEGGTALSGGQQQRLAIARALYRRSDLLILDEPTSALDARAEHTLLSALRAQGRTSVLISHRLANVATADNILVFGAGRVIEEGTHKELMEKGGLYRELYQLQANLYAYGENEVSLSYGAEQGTRS